MIKGGLVAVGVIGGETPRPPSLQLRVGVPGVQIGKVGRQGKQGRRGRQGRQHLRIAGTSSEFKSPVSACLWFRR